MQYISVKEASERWGISERRVRALCESGRIEGVTRCGDWVWSIPESTQRPADGRTLRYIKNRSLRTGSQDYKEVDSLKKTARQNTLTNAQRTEIICEILAYEGKNLTPDQIRDVTRLVKQEFDLKTHLEILNIEGAFSMGTLEVSETSLKQVNERLLCNLSTKGGTYAVSGTQAQEVEAMLSQYAGPWSVLHPVARAAFLFSELMRICPFEEANTATAFWFLENELLRAKFPPVLFGSENTSQLKAALASTRIRGNSQGLIDLIKASMEGK